MRTLGCLAVLLLALAPAANPSRSTRRRSAGRDRRLRSGRLFHRRQTSRGQQGVRLRLERRHLALRFRRPPRALRPGAEKYAPQYGGYCAWAVSQGYSADIDPEAWKIADGRAVLNDSLDVQRKWAADIPGNITKGDVNWPKLLAGD